MKLHLTLFFVLAAMASRCQTADPSQIAPFDYHRDYKPILERTKNRYDTLYYLKLLTRFQNNDSTLTRAETLALMIGYTDNQFFKPYADMMKEKDIIKLNDDGYYLDALDESKAYLQTHPLSLSTLKERSFAYYKLKKRDSARYFMDLADKIMEAMIYSGKGTAPETAFFSLGLADGDYFIPNVGLNISGRKTGKDKWRNFLFIVDAVSLEDVHKVYYFNIQHAKLKMDNEEDPDTEAAPKETAPKKQRGVPPAKPDTILVSAPPSPVNDSIPVMDNRTDSLTSEIRSDSLQASSDDVKTVTQDGLTPDSATTTLPQPVPAADQNPVQENDDQNTVPATVPPADIPEKEPASQVTELAPPSPAGTGNVSSGDSDNGNPVDRKSEAGGSE